MKMADKIDVSVIIRTLNEERWIGHTIQSVLDLIPNPEIIIVDNHSSDDTIHIIKNFIEDPSIPNKGKSYANITIYDIDEYTPGKSINFGVSKSNNDIVMLLSAHCTIQKFDKSILKKVQEFECIFGKQIPIWNGKKISPRYIWSHFVDNEIVNMYSKLEDRYFFHNGASIFTRQILIDRPFNENLTGKEDRYWINEYVSSGNKYLYLPNFVVKHHYTPSGNTWKGLA